jgi:hypothetical protein
MNKLSAYGLWCSANSKYLDLKLAFSGKPQPPTPGCTPVWFSAALRRTIVYALLSIAFHMLMWFARQPRSIVGKAFGLVPVVLIVAALGACVHAGGGGCRACFFAKHSSHLTHTPLSSPPKFSSLSHLSWYGIILRAISPTG